MVAQNNKRDPIMVKLLLQYAVSGLEWVPAHKAGEQQVRWLLWVRHVVVIDVLIDSFEHS